MFCQTVKKVSGMAAGLDHRQSVDRQRVASAQAIFGVAAADHERHHGVAGFQRLTPGPSATTLPAISSPGISGAPGGGG